MANFTAGPWEVNAPGRKFVVPARNFNHVCELNTFERAPEVVDANARLIAAAPDLLAACIQVRDYMEKMGLDWLGKGPDPLEVAIRKATGVTP